jgi:hypothetical protein
MDKVFIERYSLVGIRMKRIYKTFPSVMGNYLKDFTK